jgi:hypothetical protein
MIAVQPPIYRVLGGFRLFGAEMIDGWAFNNFGRLDLQRVYLDRRWGY